MENHPVMKKMISLVFIIALCMGLLPSNVCMAVDNELLISIGTGPYAITVTTATTIDEIKNVLGEPKVTTSSAFGGHAYTFYTDDQYSNYLYIETTENDQKIISFGSVDPSFQTSRYRYGDKYDYRYTTLSGYVMNDSGYVKGVVSYNKKALIGDRPDTTSLTFSENYKKDQTEYLKGMAKQAITMYNAASTNLGNSTQLVFNEDYFYINEQLKEQGSSIREYAIKNNKLSNLKAIKLISSMKLSHTSYAYLLNPLMWAGYAKDHKTNNFGGNTICIVDYNLDQELGYIGVVNPQMFAEEARRNKVALTEEEQNKLAEGKNEYIEAENYFEIDGDNAYEVTPQDTEAGALVAGELKQSKKDAAISYMNAIRTAAGIGKVSWSDEAYILGQYKSTLLSYLYRKKGLSALAHSFPKPDGVTDDYYQKSFGGKDYTLGMYPGIKYGEGLSMATYEQPINQHIKNDILGYIDDRKNVSGEASLGHRISFLDPNYSTVAMGISPHAGSIEYDKAKNPTTIVSGWPANGVTFMETLIKDDASKQYVFYWNTKFYRDYFVTNNTSVKVTCLNSNQVWNFTQSSKDTKHYFERSPGSNFSSTLGNQLVWKDETLIPQADDVYQIEVSNLKNSTTGKLENYTYRSVFAYADATNNQSQKIDQIAIQVPDTIEKTAEGVYRIPDDERTKLNVKINENAVDNSVKWSSSNPDVISVSQNGILTVEEIVHTPITITVCSTSDNRIADHIQVVPYETEKIPEGYHVKLNHIQYQMNTLKETVVLEDTYIPANFIQWTTTNEKIAAVDAQGRVTSQNGGFAYITANTEKYGMDQCLVYVCALRTLSDGSKVYPGDLNGDGVINASDAAIVSEWYHKDSLTEDEIAVGDINGDGVVNATDASMILDLYNSDHPFTPGNYNPITGIELSEGKISIKQGETIPLSATILIEDTSKETTDSKKLIWKSSNEQIARVDENGKVTGISGGTVDITAMTLKGIKKTCRVEVQSLQSDIIVVDQEKIICNNRKSQKITVKVESDPTKQIGFTSSNPKIAVVSKEGVVTPIKTGNCTIIVQILDGSNIQKEIPVQVTLPYIVGNYDQNDRLDVTDAYLLLNKVVNEIEITKELEEIVDMNEDGNIDVTDAYLILQLLTQMV